jgi:ATP-binding cassette subfamily B protein
MTDRLRAVLLGIRLGLRAGGWRVGVILVCNVALAVQPSANALALKELTNGALAQDWPRVAVAGGALALLIAVMFSMYGISVPMKITVSEHAERLFEQDLMRLVSAIPTLEAQENPEFVDRLAVLRKYPQVLVGVLWTLLQNISFFIGVGTALSLLASADPVLLFLPCFGLPLLVASRVSQRLRERAIDRSAEVGRRASHLFDLATTLSPGRELRIFGLHGEIADRFTAAAREANHIQYTAEAKGAFLSACGWLCFVAAWAGSISLVALRAKSGAVSPGDVVLAISIASIVQGYISGAIGLIRQLGLSLTMARRYIWLENFARRIVVGGAPAPQRINHGIELRSVSFSYPGSDVEALTDVCATLPAGATIAVVGENGAGKTTAVKLLLGLYTPSQGRILIDDQVDLSDVDACAWRERVSGVFQDFVEFEFLTREAIGFGDLPRMAQGQAIARAIDRAGADNIPELGWQLGSRWEHGVELSGGQWQQLAVARGMMRDGPVLRILDEPTASLDADTEHALFERYREIGSGEKDESRADITILVSHRFSTVRMADMILVFAKGRIIERGSHGELMALGGLYAELYRLQAQGYLS